MNLLATGKITDLLLYQRSLTMCPYWPVLIHNRNCFSGVPQAARSPFYSMPIFLP